MKIQIQKRQQTNLIFEILLVIFITTSLFINILGFFPQFSSNRAEYWLIVSVISFSTNIGAIISYIKLKFINWKQIIPFIFILLCTINEFTWIIHNSLAINKIYDWTRFAILIDINYLTISLYFLIIIFNLFNFQKRN